MRLAVVTNLYPPHVLGGYEVLTHDVVLRLRLRGHRVNVLTSQGPGDEDGQVSRTLRLARGFSQEPRRDRGRHLLAACWNGPATHAFHARYGPFDAALVMSLRRLGVEPLRVLQHSGVPLVLTVNDDWPAAFGPRMGQGWRSRLSRLADRAPWARHNFRGVDTGRVVYLSDSIRREVLAAVPSFPRGVVQAQGVDVDLFERRPFRPIVPPVALLFVGRLHPTKAPDVAIDALAEVRKQGIDAELTLAGAPVTEDYGRELRAHASNRGVADRIHWLGHVDRKHLPRIYQAADIMVFLNRWPEPQGLTYMEAMACGIPVVAHPRGGARELLQQWPVAMMAEHCTGSSVAQSIRDLVADPEQQRLQVAEAHRMLQEAASLDHYVDRLEAELQAAKTQSQTSN